MRRYCGRLIGQDVDSNNLQGCSGFMTSMTNDSASLDADGSLMLLANDLLYKAFEMRCSDFNVEPDAEQVVLRYLVNRETIKEMQLPKDVHSELVFCYKALAGLNIA